MPVRVVPSALVLFFGLVLPASAGAQAFGLGPRLSFVHSEVGSTGPATRMFGGTMRLGTSKHVALEAALDFHTEYSADRMKRVRQNPFQVSLLIFPVRSTIAPYLLAGFGVYTQHADALSAAGAVTESAMTRQTGSHFGFGGELLLTRHTAFYLDYRYRFVTFGASDPDSEPISIPGLKNLKLSHRGTMWTSGVAFYF